MTSELLITSPREGVRRYVNRRTGDSADVIERRHDSDYPFGVRINTGAELTYKTRDTAMQAVALIG